MTQRQATDSATRVHLTIVFAESDLPAIAEARHRWDPDMASGVPPHVTLVYPEEFDDVELLTDRAEEAASQCGTFTMRSDHVITTGDGDSALVYVTVLDPTGSWLALRQAILRPPFRPRDVDPHVTLVHPRTSRHGREAWAELRGADFSDTVAVSDFCLTATDREHGMRIRRRFTLAGS